MEEKCNDFETTIENQKFDLEEATDRLEEMEEEKNKLDKALKQKKADTAEQADVPQHAEPEDKVTSSFANKKNVLWGILSAGMALTVMGSQFMPGIVALDSMTSVYSAMLWVGIFGAALARYLNKNGWIGFATGSVLGVALNILASII